MTSQETMNFDVSRRGFMSGAAGLTFTISVGTLATACDGVSDTSELASVQPNAWVTIHPDNTVTIMSPAAEMGQGSMTGVPLILAEELDADWDTVNIEQVNDNWAAYGNPFFGGILYTGGSTAISAYFKPLRVAGAQARRLLMEGAARKWGVPLAELTTRPSLVVHAASGRSMTYGEAATLVEVPEQLPEITDADLKPASEFRLISHSVPRRDVPLKVNGTAQYAMDVQLPGMVYAAVMRSPVEGETPVAIDDAETRKVKGVLDVVSLPYGVAVIGETVEATRFGKDVLSVTWTEDSEARKFDSTRDLAAYSKAANDLERTGVPWRDTGDAKAGLEAAAKVVQREYQCDYTYHAQMEPLNATAAVNEAGDGAEVWGGTQSQTLAILASARALGTTPDKIKLHAMLLGGGFGLRASLDQNFIVDAVLLSKEMKKPVKVIWSREDDVANGRFRPLVAQTMRGGLDEEGNLVAWNHRVAGPSVLENFNNFRWKQVEPKDVITMLGSEHTDYEIENFLAEHILVGRGARVAPWRGVATGYTKFAAEAFMDELAEEAGMDALEFRLKILDKRARKVMETVAEMADWGRKREGTSLGLASAGYHASKGAGIAEISVNRETGDIRVHNFWIAVDVGIPVQPFNIETQVEGAAIYGLSHALKERITVVDGRVQQSNFHDYQVMRMEDVPNIEVTIIATDNPPSAVGELGLPMTGPAVANAFWAATGKRLRSLPMSPDRVLEALKA